MIYPKQHYAYLKYILRHKWFVFQACREVGVPLWQSIVHDWSKFTLTEWIPYAGNFFTCDGKRRERKTLSDADKARFRLAWNAHQKRNKHHWQYWLLAKDDGGMQVLPMQDKYIREMVADWVGAGLAITGRRDVAEWYAKHAGFMTLHADTRQAVEAYLSQLEEK